MSRPSLPPAPASRFARTALALAASALLVAGCGSKGPTLGDEIDAAGERYADVAEAWKDAEDKVAKGRKLVRRGKERVRDGEDDIERGARLIADGESEMNQSRRDYERLRALAASAPPVTADDDDD